MNRKRENANAANVDSASEKSVAQPAIRIELRNHLAKSVFAEQVLEVVDARTASGSASVELSVPSGLNAADDDEQDREQREDDRADGDEVAPADARRTSSGRSSVDLLEGGGAPEPDDRERRRRSGR